MATTARLRDLMNVLASSAARWTVNPGLSPAAEIPRHGTGARREGLKRAAKVAALDLRRVLAPLPANPWVRERRVRAGLLSSTLRPGSPFNEFSSSAGAADADPLPPEGGTAPVAIDWRTRWGWPWITTVRDQNGCQACWAFAAVALVEAMVRIEHCVWPSLSEGDVHKGMGAKCANTGNTGTALNWIQKNGLADSGCFAWTTADIPYAPTRDRNGRSVGIPAYKVLGSVAAQKQWLDLAGPLVTFFEVWTDFMAYGQGVYHKVANLAPGVPNKDEGGHFMLVVGYDDTQGCWIVKNSWGTGWGQSGYGLIAYGECDIDKYAKYALSGVDADPWTKRRHHNGNLFQGARGATHRDLESLLRHGTGLSQWRRNDGAGGAAWTKDKAFAADAQSNPVFTSTTYKRNYECVYETTGHRLHHWWRDAISGGWNDGGVFGAVDVDGQPGFIQGNYGAPGNFEVVVRTADGRLNHWWRNNAGGGWNDGGRFGQSVAASGASLLQSHRGNKGHLELVCVLAGGQMQHWVRDNDENSGWKPVASFGDNYKSPPCMIEASFGQENENAVGNFELCIAAGGTVHHWWRDNSGGGAWNQSATFGHDVAQVTGLAQGSYGFNLELVVLRSDGKHQHYWRYGGTWYEGVVIA